MFQVPLNHASFESTFFGSRGMSIYIVLKQILNQTPRSSVDIPL